MDRSAIALFREVADHPPSEREAYTPAITSLRRCAPKSNHSSSTIAKPLT